MGASFGVRRLVPHAAKAMNRTTLLVPRRRGQSEERTLDGLASAGQAQWAQEEFAQAPLPDRRLVKRLILMATDFAQHLTAPIPQACDSWGKTKAAYRFFDNDTIQPQALLEAHLQVAVERLQGHRVVLCVQDTTTLNYSTHPRSRGLGPISNNRDKTLGLLLHTALALTPTGQPLGLLQVHSWARSTRTFGRSSNARNRTPREQKESQKWMDSLLACQSLAARCPHTTLVNLADREGEHRTPNAEHRMLRTGRRRMKIFHRGNGWKVKRAGRVATGSRLTV
jgi:hypothetical protein